jgi:hypothetical protein
MSWVDYVLTTANNWKTPIKDFELVIEKPKQKDPFGPYLVSLCWDGQFEPEGANLLISRKTNYVPKDDLRVTFFQVVR